MPPKWTRYSPVPKFPLTRTLNDVFDSQVKKRLFRSDLVSEKLCDDVLQRLSPYLLRKRPLDIIDLWPGAGLWSSKINDFLQPRRHVLIEPKSLYKPLLQPMVASSASYSLLSMDPFMIDWQPVLSKYLPEQGPSNCDNTGALPINDTLLILASPPPPSSRKDHCTPQRWLSVFMDTCLQQTGLHAYGSVRLITWIPRAGISAAVPRSVVERKRTAFLTDAVALHAFEVAAPKDLGSWAAFKGMDLITENASWVAQKSAENNIVIPPGREIEPIPLAPESPDPGRIPVPYVPRPNTAFHDRLLSVINEKKPKASTKEHANLMKKRARACIQLNQDNRHAYYRQVIVQKQIEIDDLTKSLSRLAANPEANFASLEPVMDKIKDVKSSIEKLNSELHFEVAKQAPIGVDDMRAALSTGKFDDAYFPWDRRPFEPLLIGDDEFYPRGLDPKAMIYFEPSPQSIAMQKLNELSPAERDHPRRLFEALTLALGSRSSMSVAELLQLIFPNRPLNDIVKAVPSLATFAAKTPKPNFDSLPKTIHGPPGEAQDKNLDPNMCYQENLDYDLSDVRFRVLSTETLWDIFVEYQKNDNHPSPTELSRILGGTLTTFRSGQYLEKL